MRELDSIAQLTARAANPADPLYADLLEGIAETAGLHPQSLQRLVGMWTSTWQRPDLEKALRRGLGPHPGAVRPIGKVAIVAPGNLCVATWQAMLEPLLVGNRVTVRPGSGDPRAPENLRRALRQVDAELGDRIEIADFARDDEASWMHWLKDCQALCVYGGDTAISSLLHLASRAGFGGRLRLHGHYQSIGVLDAELIDDPVTMRAIAAGWAVDTLLADGRGCMSLRALWLVGKLDAAARAEVRRALASALERAAKSLPPGQLDVAWQAELALFVQNHAFQVANSAASNSEDSPGEEAWLEEGDTWSLLGHASGTPAGTQSPGPGARSLVVYEARDAADLMQQLEPWRGKLSTVSLAVDADSHGILDAIERLGAHRTCQPGAMQAPRADRAPDGHMPFTSLVRQTDRN